MTTKTTKVLLIEAGVEPVMYDLPEGLEPIQKLVGGYFTEAVLPIDTARIAVYCNDGTHGTDDLPPNRVLARPGLMPDVLHGTLFVAKVGRDGEFTDLSEAEGQAALAFLKKV